MSSLRLLEMGGHARGGVRHTGFHGPHTGKRRFFRKAAGLQRHSCRRSRQRLSLCCTQRTPAGRHEYEEFHPVSNHQGSSAAKVRPQDHSPAMPDVPTMTAAMAAPALNAALVPPHLQRRPSSASGVRHTYVHRPAPIGPVGADVQYQHHRPAPSLDTSVEQSPVHRPPPSSSARERGSAAGSSSSVRITTTTPLAAAQQDQRRMRYGEQLQWERKQQQQQQRRWELQLSPSHKQQHHGQPALLHRRHILS